MIKSELVVSHAKMPRHPLAAVEAKVLVDAYDGSAEEIVEEGIAHSLEGGDPHAALVLDQVRREIERIYGKQGR